MKLAEALKERADLNKKIEQLRTRLRNNALYQEGERPAEDPAELLSELDVATKQLKDVVSAINHTNAKTTALEDRTLTELIAEKDALTLQVAAYRELIDTASQRVNRYSKTEIKILSAVNVKQLQSKADKISKRIRLIDNALQESNWTTELLKLKV